MFMVGRFTQEQKKNVRHWAMEFVVVVAGVLLAMWLQDWVERRRALADMRAAEDAIHDEVQTALRSVMWRKAIAKCHIERQQLLKSMLLKPGDDWPGLTEDTLAISSKVPASIIPSVYSRPLDSLTTAAWSSALATGALAPMDRERFGRLVGVYDQIEAWRRARDDENAAVLKMSALALPLRLTPQLRAQMIEGIYQVDRARFAFAYVGAKDLADEMRELGWNDAAIIDRTIQEDASNIKASGWVFRPCVAPEENPFRESPAAGR